jgi:hypothetical protein
MLVGAAKCCDLSRSSNPCDVVQVSFGRDTVFRDSTEKAQQPAPQPATAGVYACVWVVNLSPTAEGAHDAGVCLWACHLG